MDDELSALLETAAIFDHAGIDYMLTGSVALNYYATPRMTRDIDLVAAIFLKDVERITELFLPDQFYVSAEAARAAVFAQSSFNLIHQATLTKIDVMIRKREEYRLAEFERRHQIVLRGKKIWIVSREDLILSKLDWARESFSERQLDDVRNLLAEDCDEEYLRSWAKRLQLSDILTQVLD